MNRTNHHSSVKHSSVNARKVIAAAGFSFFLLAMACGQVSQFAFDANGNLQANGSENIALPEIFSQPQLQVAAPGALASFFVVAANTRDLTYQWRFNGTNIDGANNDALLLQNIGASNEGSYSVVLINPSGSVTSAPAALLLDGDGDGLPDSWELVNFGNLSQATTGDFDRDGVSNAEEFLDGTNPANRASARFRLTVLSDGGLVTVAPARVTYTNGETVTLTASTPFRAWTGDANTTNNPITLTMTTNRTVFAHGTSLNLTWTNLADGDWDLASNWKPNFVPTTNDTAFITESVRVTNHVAAACSSLVLGRPGTPVLTGSGTLTLHGDSFWLEGTMGGTGRTVVAPGATLNVQNFFAGVTLSTRTLENAGTILWTGGNIGMNGGIITNRAGALFHARNAASLTFGSAGNRFDNAGTFRKSGHTGTTTLAGGIPFNNYGTAEIQTGTLLCGAGWVNDGAVTLSPGTTLRLAAGGSAGGPFSAPATALVEWTGRTFLLNPGAQLEGAGLYKINGGTLTFNTDVAVADMEMLGPLNGPGVLTVNNVLNWTSGTMGGAGRTIIAPAATLNVNNPLAVTLSARTLENAGTILWTGGNIGMNGGVITNRAGALFDAQNAASFTFGSAGNRFDNAGTFRKSGNTGPTTMAGGVPFNNYGTAEIQTGTLLCGAGWFNNGAVTLSPGATLRLASGGSASGSFSTPATALVEWTGGTFLLNPGAQLEGAGLYKINGGTLTFNTDVAVADLEMLSPLNGPGVLTVNNLMNWTSGTMGGTGRTVVAPGATLNVNNPLAVTLSARTLENAGTILWTGGNIVMSSGGVITNRAGALFHAQNAASLAYFSGVNRFDNAGTFRKSGNTGTTTLAGGVFNNYNTLEIRSGILAANVGYTSSSGAMLRCALGGTNLGTGYGRLQVSGAITLNGALRVDLIDGFIPAVSDSFTVLTAGTRSGTFGNFHYPSNQLTMQMSNTANSVIVRVTDVLIVSDLVLLQPELSGSNIRLTWTAISNTIYRLEYKTDLGLADWSILSGDVTSLSNTASKLDTLTTSNRFYRVRVLPE